VKRVIFKSVKIQNFLSVGETPLTLNFQSGISIITGENRDKGGRNGVGKSTIVESLYWCLFGNTMREIKRERIVHRQSDGNCCVILEFNVVSSNKVNAYTLIRTISPNSVKLYCNEEDITLSSMPKTDEKVKELIGANEEVFRNAVIMAANNTLPFMAQKKVDKRKFVEGILQLGIFSEMLLQIRLDHNDLKKENDLCSAKFIEKQKNLEIYIKQFQKTENVKIEKIDNLKTKISINKEKIETESKLDLNALEQEKNDLLNSISKKEQKIKKLEELSLDCSGSSDFLKKQENLSSFKIAQLKKELEALKEKTQTCPTCKRSYEDHDKKHIEELCNDIDVKIKTEEESKKLLTADIKQKNKDCKDIVEAIKTLNTQIKKDSDSIHNFSIISKEIKHLTDINNSLQKEIEEIQNSKNEFESLISNIKEEIAEEETKLEDLQKRISVLEVAKYVVSEEGVKTYIIKKMLVILNSRLNHYLQILEAPCKCEFNEVFEETIHDEYGKESSYFNYSAGEQKRIDLAILFMFQDLLRQQTGTSFSLSMYDELFDSAIDEKGVDKILDILKDRVEKFQENIYIISHNTHTSKSGVDQIILLEKHNGETKLIEQI